MVHRSRVVPLDSVSSVTNTATRSTSSPSESPKRSISPLSYALIMAPKDDPETAALKKEIESLKEGLKSAQTGSADKTITDVCSGLGDIPRLRLQTKRMLKGHIHKVNAIHFAGDSR